MAIFCLYAFYPFSSFGDFPASLDPCELQFPAVVPVLPIEPVVPDLLVEPVGRESPDFPGSQESLEVQDSLVLRDSPALPGLPARLDSAALRDSQHLRFRC
ncbi:hypothetical protein SDC9_184093 [bioreactor metagenome]|uniref:Uncharacterized protein n=1 Tax=bioreactor metagenome TaxID=1076179 RepID=A0A645HKC3_9ZZZZ